LQLIERIDALGDGGPDLPIRDGLAHTNDHG
jgi:hypothetical protein